MPRCTVQPSPYTPGEVARDVPGRAAQLAEADERLSYLLDLHKLVGRIRIDVAARGIGKTSLLREVQRRADAAGAVTAWITAGESGGLLPAIADALERATATWRQDARRRLAAVLDRLTVTVGVPGAASIEVAPARRTRSDEPTRDHPPHWVRDFEQVVRETVTLALKERRRGLVLFIDEIQSADAAGLRTLAYAWQHLQSEARDLPAAVFAAGLPNTPETIAAVVTFSERFAYRTLERLTDDAAALALVAPAAAARVGWDDDALAAAVRLAQGYPYSVQLIGEATWIAAGHPDPGARLTAAHVRAGEMTMRDDMDALFRSRWQTSTPAERRLLRVMAELGGDAPVQRADIARRMSATTEELSVPRARLLDKGLVQSAGHGKLEFTIPGFADYVITRAEWTETAGPTNRA